MKENTEPVLTEKRRPRGKWKDSIIIFLVLPVIFTFLVPLGWVFYLHGKFSPYAGSRALVVILFATAPIFVVWCLLTRIVRIFDVQVRNNRKGKIVIGTEIGVSTVFLALFIIAVFTPIELGSCPSGYVGFLHGFRDRVRGKADVAAIRDWLGTLDKEDCTRRSFSLISDSGSSGRQWPDSIDWPESVKVFKPRFVQFPVDDNDNLKVRLCWGTGMTRSWGVEIGPEDMEIPPSDLSRYGEHRLPLERGAYVWHELR